MNSAKNNELILHKAAKTRRVEMIRQSLYEKQCDPNALNMHGKTAAFMYFINLLTKSNDCGSDKCLTNDEISCFTELIWFTYDTQWPMRSERQEVFDMIDYCFQFSDVPIRKLFMVLVDVFIAPTHHRRYFVEKILKANLPSDYCLIASIFEMNEMLKDADFVRLRSNFLSELFTLYLANQSFFEEYISEVMSTGWTFDVHDQSWAFSVDLDKHQSNANAFGFMKYLIRYEIDFAKLLKLCLLHLQSETADSVAINAWVPLSNFISAPIDLARIMRQGNPTESSYHNFNETEDILDDFKSFVEMESNVFPVVSLKNLARMSLRKYFFSKHTHYRALSLLYSLNIPVSVRNFLCYNYYKFKF